MWKRHKHTFVDNGSSFVEARLLTADPNVHLLVRQLGGNSEVCSGCDAMRYTMMTGFWVELVPADQFGDEGLPPFVSDDAIREHANTLE